MAIREITASNFVTELSQKCLGFHFASAKSLGKTTHAFISAKGEMHNKIANEIELDRAIINMTDTSTLPRALKGLFQSIADNAMQNRLTKEDPSALLAPVLLNVKGSAVDSITTVCRIKGYMRLTSEFYACELEILSAMHREAKLIGPAHTHNTIAKRIASMSNKSMSHKLGTSSLREFMVAFRLSHNMEFGIALASVFKALQVVRRGFLDSGKQFRDTSSRSMAANAFRESIYNVLNIGL